MTGSKSQIKSRRYCFDDLVRMDPSSSQDDDCKLFKEILRGSESADANIKISGLENCSFFYDVPDEGLVKYEECCHGFASSAT